MILEAVGPPARMPERPRSILEQVIWEGARSRRRICPAIRA